MFSPDLFLRLLFISPDSALSVWAETCRTDSWVSRLDTLLLSFDVAGMWRFSQFSLSGVYYLLEGKPMLGIRCLNSVNLEDPSILSDGASRVTAETVSSPSHCSLKALSSLSTRKVQLSAWTFSSEQPVFSVACWFVCTHSWRLENLPDPLILIFRTWALSISA